MFSKIKSLFDNSTDTAQQREPAFEDKNLAVAALLVEAATQDGSFDEEERNTIKEITMRAFSMSEAESEALLQSAQAAQGDATHILRFTRTIKDNYSEEERIELIEMLWEVVYADGELDDYESNLIRRIGGLIYVSDRDRGEARLRVLHRMGLGEDN